MKPSTSGATGVFFVEDDSPTPVGVKASTDPVDVTNFSSLLHGRLGAGKAPTTRAATAEEREGFTALLEDGDKVDQEAWEKYAATLGPNVTVDEAREHRITNFKRNPIMYVMGTAQGKDFRAIAEGKDPHNSVQNLLLNREYLYKLGLVTAIDCFMGNEDRLLSGNLGNWMTGSNFDRDITVIDNVDTMTRMSFGHQYRQRNIELNDPVRRLAPSRINELAQTCVRVMLAALAHDVPDKDWSDLSDTPMFKNRMVEEIQRGLKDGRKRLIKKLTPAIFRKRSRSIKAGVVGGEGQDPQGLWNYIKYRASFLKGQR